MVKPSKSSKPSRIDDFFKRMAPQTSRPNLNVSSSISIDPTLPEPELPPIEIGEVETELLEQTHLPSTLEVNASHQVPVDPQSQVGLNHSSIPTSNAYTDVDIANLQRDPGLRMQICDYPIHHQDEIRRAYIKLGPYQPILDFPRSGNRNRRFRDAWYKKFKWLEYSLVKDAAFCHPCFIFNRNITESGFTSEGFKSWWKVNSGKDCSFLRHMEKDSNSVHNMATQACEDLMRQTQDIQKIYNKLSIEQIAKNRLRLKVSIDTVRWLTFQACAFRGHNESPDSINRGNFLEFIKILSSYNEKVSQVVLENAPKNAQYTSPPIQKEILQIISTKVRNAICEEIGSAKFCIIVDEARDESKREQMAIVLRFVDKEGFIRERFFDIVHVRDTIAKTLKDEISLVLSHNNLSVQSIRGQGYDGASNMRGEWNGLKALFLHECPYAYYVHCFAHRLQLALVAAAKEVIPVCEFFTKLTRVANIVGASCKRHDELQAAQAITLAELLANSELESGTGLNQIGTLQRAGDTRWSSYYTSVNSLLRMYEATCKILVNLKGPDSGCNYTQKADADASFKSMISFEFVFILHLMQEVMGITDILCQALQSQSQDILNAIRLVKTTKTLLQALRESGWDAFLKTVLSFCSKYELDVPEMGSFYAVGRSRFQEKQQHKVTVEHHYRFDIFNEAIDKQWSEVNNRFNEHTMEIFVLSSALDPKDSYKSFNIDDICNLADTFYPEDFTVQEKIALRYELQHYGLDVTQHPELKNLSTLSELCQGMAKTKKSETFPLVDRMIRLVLTLPVSTATTERAFSAMKLVKTRLRNKMEDEFLANSLISYIEKEIAGTFSTDSIIDEFSKKKRRLEF